MKTEVETKTWAMCPECPGRVGTVDHLSPGDEAGPWYCDDCGRGWWLSVKEDGIEHRPHDHMKRRTVVTLKLPPQDAEVWFTLDGFATARSDEPIGDDAYFYDEHTCPTNWLGNVTMVAFKGDNDPHGLFRWVSTVEAGTTDDRRAAAAAED